MDLCGQDIARTMESPCLNSVCRLASIVNQAFCFKNGKKRYEYIVVKYNSTYFVKSHSDAKHKYTEDDIVRMINFLIDNIFVESGGEIFQ